MFFLCLIFAVGYLVLLLWIWYWWTRGLRTLHAPGDKRHSISVIIPARNESENILALLEKIKQCDYPSFDVVVVDDHSTDGTRDKVIEWITDHRKYRCIANLGEGKKRAITTGVASSKGEIVVTTDADCRVGDQWLYDINNAFHTSRTMLAFGGVAIESDGRLLSDMQAIEFASLIGSGAAFAASGRPIMCNGANLAFRREAFEGVNGYEGNFHVASGDDEFLMRKISGTYHESVAFIPSPVAVVRTRPKSSLVEFISQRLRWAGKWRNNSSVIAKFTAVFVLMVQLSLIVMMLILVFPVDRDLKLASVSILTARFLIEGFLLRSICRFLKVRWKWTAYVLLQLFYPFYVVIIGLFSNFLPVKWKNRSIL